MDSVYIEREKDIEIFLYKKKTAKEKAEKIRYLKLLLTRGF